MTVIVCAALLLTVAAGCFGYRLVRGPSLADRVIGLDGLLVVGASALAVNALRSGSGAFLVVIVVITLVGFVGTSIAARFIERRGM